MAETPTLLNPKELRKQREVTVAFDDGTSVVATRIDITTMLMDGQMPMPMLVAVQKMIERPDLSPTEQLALLGAENTKSLIEVMREHACRVVRKPVITREDDGRDDHLPVTMLSVQQLTQIWNATTILPRVGVEAAVTFREPASVADAPAAPDGEDVRATAEPMAGVVEFISQ